jgi:hypothetical protein
MKKAAITAADLCKGGNSHAQHFPGSSRIAHPAPQILLWPAAVLPSFSKIRKAGIALVSWKGLPALTSS